MGSNPTGATKEKMENFLYRVVTNFVTLTAICANRLRKMVTRQEPFDKIVIFQAILSVSLILMGIVGGGMVGHPGLFATIPLWFVAIVASIGTKETI